MIFASPRPPTHSAPSLRTIATFYYDQYTQLAQSDPATALNAAYVAIRYYDRYLAVSPDDNDAKVDESAMLFYTGQTDKAIQLVTEALKSDRDHVNGNYNLGIFLWQGNRHDFNGAAAQFEKVIALTRGNTQLQNTFQGATMALAEVKSDAAAAGRPVTSASTTPSAVASSGASTQ